VSFPTRRPVSPQSLRKRGHPIIRCAARRPHKFSDVEAGRRIPATRCVAHSFSQRTLTLPLLRWSIAQLALIDAAGAGGCHTYGVVITL